MRGAMRGFVGAANGLPRGWKYAVRRPVVALALIAACAVLQGRAQAQSQDIPLQLLGASDTSAGNIYYRLGINVGIGSGPPRLYLFDTGSVLYGSADSSQWWPSLPPTVASLSGFSYGSGITISGNVVNMPTISFYASSTATTSAYTLPTITPGYQITAVTSATVSNYSTNVETIDPSSRICFMVGSAQATLSTLLQYPLCWAAYWVSHPLPTPPRAMWLLRTGSRSRARRP